MAKIQRAGLFASKVMYKSFWELSSRFKSSPHVTELHRRSCDGDDGVYEFVNVVEEPAYIEPEWGYVITARGNFIESSLQPNFPYHLPPWRVATPSPLRFMEARHSDSGNTRHFPVVISLRHLWEWNYYHFYFDVLGKLRLFYDVGIDQATPVVLGNYVNELRWSEQIIHTGYLSDSNWIIQGNDFILADKIIYGRTRQNYKHKLDYVLDRMNVPIMNHIGNERVFLSRRTGRKILNFEEILPVLKEFNFRVVDTASMSIAEQVQLFSNTRVLLAIHGAGVTNAIFRRDAPLSVIELHSRNYISTDFRRMCREYGYSYDTLDGDPDGRAPQHASFRVSADRLRAKLRKVLRVE